MANGVRWARDTRDLSARLHNNSHPNIVEHAVATTLYVVLSLNIIKVNMALKPKYDKRATAADLIDAQQPLICDTILTQYVKHTIKNKVQVWCDMETDGGGWTVFLSRQAENPREDFNRSWAQYKKGFGDRSEEYWLGLEALHAITSSRKYNLRLDLLLSNNIPVYNIWQNFRIGSEDTGYRLTWRTFSTLDDTMSSNCLTYANGRSFSTYDVDEDVYSGNCAALRGGGWWYYDCQQFNPTNSGGDNAGETGFNISCLNRDFPLAGRFSVKGFAPPRLRDKVKPVYLNPTRQETVGLFSGETPKS
nr:microfibril-associated glycoprotein 4-like [Cherax quadricarinatus]